MTQQKRRRTLYPISANTEITENANPMFMTMASQLMGRALLAARMGKSYGTDRDLYTALGYNKTLVYEDYWARYERQDVANRIVEAPVAGTWRKKPIISEGEPDETEFEKAWNMLVKNTSLYHYIARTDIVSGIGRYGVMFLGFDDNPEHLTDPVEQAKELLFIRPYSEINATIQTWEADKSNPRFGMPLFYTLQPVESDHKTQFSVKVHYTRVVHMAEGLLEDDVYGAPRLRKVINRLQDLELVSGSSAEMFWRGAFPGYGFALDPEASPDPQTMTALKDEIDDYIHGLKRYVRTQGIEVKELAQQVADPTKQVDILIQLISAATGIPKRILTGSERGELASGQDESNWNTQLDARRVDYAEPMILRPVIDRLIGVGVLPEPKTGEYNVNWPDLEVPSEKDEADVGKVRTEALAAYANAPGAQMIIPPRMFLTDILKYTEEQADKAETILGGFLEAENEEIVIEET